jgi:hypothetical protein
VVNSWIFIELIEQAGPDKVITDADIERIISSIQTPDGSQRYTSSTVPRRRQTITAWMKWLSQEIGCFEIVEGGYALR